MAITSVVGGMPQCNCGRRRPAEKVLLLPLAVTRAGRPSAQGKPAQRRTRAPGGRAVRLAGPAGRPHLPWRALQLQCSCSPRWTARARPTPWPVVDVHGHGPSAFELSASPRNGARPAGVVMATCQRMAGLPARLSHQWKSCCLSRVVAGPQGLWLLRGPRRRRCCWRRVAGVAVAPPAAAGGRDGESAAASSCSAVPLRRRDPSPTIRRRAHGQRVHRSPPAWPAHEMPMEGRLEAAAPPRRRRWGGRFAGAGAGSCAGSWVVWGELSAPLPQAGTLQRRGGLRRAPLLSPLKASG